MVNLTMCLFKHAMEKLKYFPLNQDTISGGDVIFGLKRELGLAEAIAIGVGSAVGTGVVKLHGAVGSLMGPFGVLAWILAGAIVALVYLCFAELGSGRPESGSLYYFVKDSLGEVAGFTISWSYWLAQSLALGALSLASAESILLAFSIPEDKVKLLVLALIVLFCIMVVNIIGVRVAGKVQDVLTILKIGLLLFFVVSVLASTFKLENFAPGKYFTTFNASSTSELLSSALKNIGLASLIVIWAYIGIEEVVIPGEEIKDPERNIPRAIVLSLILVISLYVIVAITTIGALGSDIAKYGTKCVEIAVRRALGTLAGSFFSLFLVFSFIAVMNSSTLINSRIIYGYAKDGVFPRIFANIHPKFRTPYIAIICQTLIGALALIIIGSFIDITIICNLLMLIPYLSIGPTLLANRMKCSSDVKGIRIKGGEVIALLAFILSAYLIGQARVSLLLYSIIVIFAGLPIYYIMKRETD